MKPFAFIAAFFLTVGAAALSSARLPLPQSVRGAGKIPVVVELFTSEGCSSCPAADEALRELAASQSLPGIEVVALGLHVDYWNRLGWKDSFSSSEFTERQRVYAQRFGEGSYTPQAVVNGRYELVGSRRQALREAVLQAAQAPRASVRLTQAAQGTLQVTVDDQPVGSQPAEVLLALTETELASQVGRGENRGRLLRHAAVVRVLRRLGTVAANGSFAATVPLQLDAQWKARNLRAVVVVQEQASRYIVGVATLPLGGVESPQ
ncbi:DUF1223 domain-containing protein [Hymenobacter saemangeumensis]